MVDLERFELSTSSMPWKRAPNCATGPQSVVIQYITAPFIRDRPAADYNELMLCRRGPAVVILVALLSSLSTSCLVRRRSIARKGGKVSQALQVADRPTLINAVARQYDSIRDFSAEVNMI